MDRGFFIAEIETCADMMYRVQLLRQTGERVFCFVLQEHQHIDWQGDSFSGNADILR